MFTVMRQRDADRKANNADPDQTDPVSPGSTLFAQACLYEYIRRLCQSQSLETKAAKKEPTKTFSCKMACKIV